MRHHFLDFVGYMPNIFLFSDVLRNIYTVGVKRMSPVDTELLFIILYNIIALHRNINIFFYGNQVI